MSNKKNEWSPNETQRATLLALQKESGANQAEFCAEFGSSCIGTPSKLSQILDALEAGKTSYFNKIEDPEALMRELAEFMDELPELQQRRMMSEDVKILPLSHFAATAIAARECRDKKSPERAIQYIAPTGGSKSFLFQHLAKKAQERFFHGLRQLPGFLEAGHAGSAPARQADGAEGYLRGIENPPGRAAQPVPLRHVHGH